MPLYEYRCQSCEHELEALQSFRDAPLKDCPECGRPELKKKVSAPAFTFKGEGWYKDLYGKPAPKKDSDSAKTDKDSGSTSTTAATSTSADGGSKSSTTKKASSTN